MIRDCTCAHTRSDRYFEVEERWETRFIIDRFPWISIIRSEYVIWKSILSLLNWNVVYDFANNAQASPLSSSFSLSLRCVRRGRWMDPIHAHLSIYFTTMSVYNSWTAFETFIRNVLILFKLNGSGTLLHWRENVIKLETVMNSNFPRFFFFVSFLSTISMRGWA